MRTPICLATIVAMVLSVGFAAPKARGQSAGINAVVIDIPKIFKNHTRFKAAIDDIKKDIDAYKQYMTQQQKKLRAESEKLQQYKPGTVEYKQIEEGIARMNVEAQLEGAKRQKEFMEREAKEYYNTYQEIEAAVAEFAARNRINLVLRFSSQEIDPAKRESIMQGVNRIVVYQNRLDITDIILDQLNRGTPPAREGGTSPVPISQPVIPRPRTNYR